MPPKVRITKEEIVNAALEIVRESGAESINARTVAARLQCSTQPVFSNFASMEELRLAAVQQAMAVYEQYCKRESESGRYPAYKASGMAYIRFAREEKELFRLLFMRERAGHTIPEELDIGLRAVATVQHATGLDSDAAKLFHLEMWAFVHGIAAMLATGYLDLSGELISQMLTDAYQGLTKHYGKE